MIFNQNDVKDLYNYILSNVLHKRVTDKELSNKIHDLLAYIEKNYDLRG